MNISIPSVNFRKLNEKNNEEIDTLRRGLIETGFFYVFEHGICAKLLEKVESLSRMVYGADCDERIKLKKLAESPFRHTGNIFTLPAHNAEETTLIDEKEIDLVYWEFYKNVKKLSLSLIECIEIALEIEIGAISKYYCLDPGCFLHAYFYPKGYETPEHGQRFDAHTDKGFITLLWQDDIGGLEALLNDTWVPVPPKDGHFVVNIADMLEFITSGIVKAPVHRVIYQDGDDRYSFPFFLGPSADSFLIPIKKFDFNKSNMTQLKQKQPKKGQTFKQWFVENVRTGTDVGDTVGTRWRMTEKNGQADLTSLFGIEF